MRRFYIEHIEADQFTLPEEESKHIVRVLRMQNGDSLELVDGKGTVVTAEIVGSHPKKCNVRVIERTSHGQDPYSIHIAIAPTKNLDRMEWFVEKCAELGIHKISFLLCDNNERKVLKTERIHKIAVAAMKQSKRTFLPIIEEIMSLEDFLKRYPKGYIAHCYESEKFPLNTYYAQESLPILIGPEGDFSQEEVVEAIKSGYISVTLGQTRLRTETAGLYACSIAKLLLEEQHHEK